MSKYNPKDHKIISLVVLLLIAVAGYFIYERVALEMNKRDFQQARAAIDIVYADIVSQLGQPDDSKRTSDCTRSYQELTGYGNLSCNVREDFLYGVQNEDNAKKIQKKIQNSISKYSKFKPARGPSTISDSLVLSTYYHTAEDNYKFSSLNCVASYVYDTPSEIHLNIRDKKQLPFETSLGCYGQANAQLYPLAY